MNETERLGYFKRSCVLLDCLVAHHAVRKRFLIETKTKLKGKGKEAAQFNMSTTLGMSSVNRVLCQRWPMSHRLVI